jgi:hypothetical protein
LWIFVIVTVLALVSSASAGVLSQKQSEQYANSCSSYEPTASGGEWVLANVTYPGSVSCFDVDLMDGFWEVPKANDYLGWCIGSKPDQLQGKFEFIAHSSLLPTEGLPDGISDVNWKKVNYVINHKNGADKYTVQAVIWHYYGGQSHTWGTVNPDKYAELVEAADAHPDYIPQYPENHSVIFWGTTVAQPVFIEAQTLCPPCGNCGGIPEFPSQILPIALIVGILGAVQLIRRSSEL